LASAAQGDLKDEDDYFKGVATQTHPAEESDISDSTLSQLYGFNSNTLTLLRHLPPALQNFRAPADPTAREPVAEVCALCPLRWRTRLEDLCEQNITKSVQ
jgi:hypothetical protein